MAFKTRIVDPHIRIEVKGGKWPHERFFEYLSTEQQKEHVESFKKALHEIEAQIHRHVDVDYLIVRLDWESRCEFCDEPEKGSLDEDGMPVCCDAAQAEWLREHPEHPDANRLAELFPGTQEALDALTIRGES